jgi:hypothetical protein
MGENEKLTIAVDFDGTIVSHNFPEMGKEYPGAFNALRKLQELGHELILFTCREDYDDRKYLTEAVDYCKEHGIVFDAINENTEYHQGRGFQTRKPFFNILLDDRAGFLPQFWGTVPTWVESEVAKRRAREDL